MSSGVWISGRSAAYYLDPAFNFEGGFVDFDSDIAERGLLGYGRLVRWAGASVDPWDPREVLDRTFGAGAWDDLRGPVTVPDLKLQRGEGPPVIASVVVWLFKPTRRIPVPSQYRGTVPVKRARIPVGEHVVDLPAHWSDAQRLRGPFEAGGAT